MSTKVQRLETFMRTRIQMFLANGGKLAQGAFVHQDGCRCAVAACIPSGMSPLRTHEWALSLSAMFGESLTPTEVGSIAAGFDLQPRWPGELSEFFNLGDRLAREFL